MLLLMIYHCKVFEELGIHIDPDELVKWLDSDANDSGSKIFTEDEICDIVSGDRDEEEDEEEEEEEPCLVTNSDAARMFESCLYWLEHQPEATVYNTSVLRELHDLAAGKRMESLKQTTIKK